MAHLDPRDAFEHLKDRVLEGLQAQFPIKGRFQSLHLDKLDVPDALHPDDLRAQHAAKVSGETWAVPVYAQLSLRDNDGKVIDQRRVRIAELPKTTSRYSYIVGGQEYQVDNQWQLKPGIYARRRDNGELESHFNVTGRGTRAFDIVFDPPSKLFFMQYGGSRAKIPVYPLMKTMGVDDASLERAWGKEILHANQTAPKVSTALDTFYRTGKKAAPPDKNAAAQYFYDAMHSATLRPDATQVTVGKPFSNVTGDALRLATEKMLKVQSGHPEDDRDSLVFKDLRTTGDFAFDKLRNAQRAIRMKGEKRVNTAKDVRDVVKFDLFNAPLRETFTKNSAARTATQINPLEMVSSSLQTTIMGQGGIQSERSVTDEAKFVNPSHLGFLDPIHTPEGEKTGITLRLPIGLKKVGNEAKLRLYNLRSKKMEDVSPTQFMQAKVVLPDQVQWDGATPKPIAKTVRLSDTDNQIRDGHFHDADYVMPLASQLFNMTSNLIPFLGNTSGGRASMASRQMEQAVSLMHREKPLVQVSTGAKAKGADTFENLMGHRASHQSPVDGKVVSVQPGAVVVQDALGAKHEVQLYNHFPLNEAKGVMHSTPLEHIQPGASVKKGDILADTNFAKGGTLALGTNLRVGYVPFKGYNFEDGIVISESAAQKLSSEHLHKPALPIDKETVLDKDRFFREHPGAFKPAQMAKLNDRGIIRVGQRVEPGDPLVAAMKPYNLKDRTGLSAIRKSMSGAHTDKSVRWDSDFHGEVVGVHESKDGVAVHVRTVEPMQVGDKMAGRYGNKGIVTMILPDQEMPHTKNGKHIEVALNPSGVPGRMNVGQVLQTAAGKIAQKTGQTYVVKNFEPDTNYLEKVKSDLKKHGLSDTEELFDPVTKQSLGPALVGPQHLLKLVHQVEKKLSVRSGLPSRSGAQEGYDLNLQPTKGGGMGGQSAGTLGLYALLAHGAKANIREMQTYKSEGPDPQTNPSKQWPSDHNRIWAAITTGTPLPPPKPTFAFQKFTDMLRGAGINVEKNGHDHTLTLSPLTDEHIKQLAKRELPKPAELLHSKLDKNGDPKPKAGGLFDEQLTGGHGGRQWTRIGLAEPMPNPIFEGPIRALTGLKKTDFAAIVGGERGVTPNGHITDTDAGLTGGHGIKLLLDRIDVKKELPKAEAALLAAKGQKVNDALKKVKYLRALDQLNMSPTQAYVLHNIPVLPPVMRPIARMPDGAMKFSDMNGLYSNFAKVNEKLKDPVLVKNLTDDRKKELRREVYDGVKAIMGFGSYGEVDHKGILHEIAGPSPKKGYFQRVLINRRQDLTMRSTIVPEPKLGLDEVGIPQNAALDLFKPFVVRKLREMGAIQNELQGPATIEKRTPQVWKALDKVMEERPVLLKRDPALHKHSVQAFRARRAEGNAIQIHPLVTGGYNADFDGDTMSVFVPVTREAVSEAHGMFPSKNLFSEATGKVMYQPTLESALGLFKLSDVGKKTDHAFTSHEAVLEAAKKNRIGVNDVIRVPSGHTTAGRVLIAATLPEPMKKTVLHDLDLRLDTKKGLNNLLTTLAKDHAHDFGTAVNQLKDLGNGASFGAVPIPRPSSAGHNLSFKMMGSTPVAAHDKDQEYIAMGTHTLSLKDFEPDKQVRDQVLNPAHREADRIRADHKLSQAEKDRQVISVYEQADAAMKDLHTKKSEKNPSNLFKMYQAGVKPGWDQYKQMVLAPMIYKDSSDKKIPTPVTKSYAEGLDIGSYWTQMHGARRGAVMKVQEVRDPGSMSKLLMNNMMHMLVSSPDCGTDKGIALDAHEHDVHDRYLQQDFSHGKLHVPAGTLLTPDVVGKIRAAKKDARVIVRSPLKCEEEKGVCQKCGGLNSSGHHHDLGTNIGVQSAHAVGERAVQLTLKSFHTGGAESAGGSKLLSSFERFDQLMRLPEKIPDQASLAMVTGKVEKIQPTATGVDVFIGGQKHHVGKDTSGVPLHLPAPNGPATGWTPPKVGAHFKAGDLLSDPARTFVNPHHLYEATGSMEEVQNHLANEVYKLYAGEGIKRRAVETVVRAMGNLTKVMHPGDHPTVLRGEFRPLSSVNRMNQELQKQGLQPIDHHPVLKGVQVMPLAIQEDWMAKLQHEQLRATLMEAAATRGVSNIHGPHPIPGIAYGAEFGLNAAHSTTPGLEKLKNVPKHHY